MGKNISYEKKGKIAFITLDRPDKLNAINFEMAEELRIAWERFKKDDECLVAILSGAGRSFCAGFPSKSYLKGNGLYMNLF